MIEKRNTSTEIEMPRGRKQGSGPKAAQAAGKGRRGRPRRGGNGDARLADIVTRYTNDLITAVRQEVRRSVADEVRDVLTGSRVAGLVGARSGRRATNGRKRIVACIAPGCSNPSKGPRFHYLCDKHKDAKKADYEA